MFEAMQPISGLLTIKGGIHIKVKICDQIMGSGKTQAAITRMNEDTGSPYLFITPYLTECDRIIESCGSRRFVQPKRTDKTKYENVQSLIDNGVCITATH